MVEVRTNSAEKEPIIDFEVPAYGSELGLAFVINQLKNFQQQGAKIVASGNQKSSPLIIGKSLAETCEEITELFELNLPMSVSNFQDDIKTNGKIDEILAGKGITSNGNLRKACIIAILNEIRMSQFSLAADEAFLVSPLRKSTGLTKDIERYTPENIARKIAELEKMSYADIIKRYPKENVQMWEQTEPEEVALWLKNFWVELEKGRRDTRNEAAKI